MEAIDTKIIKELQSLRKDLKRKLLGYIIQLKASNVQDQKDGPSQSSRPKKKITSKPGYGGAVDLLEYVPDNLDQLSLEEDFEDYL